MIEDVRRLSIYTLNQASTIPQSNKFQFQVPVQRTFNRNVFVFRTHNSQISKSRFSKSRQGERPLVSRAVAEALEHNRQQRVIGPLVAHTGLCH